MQKIKTNSGPKKLPQKEIIEKYKIGFNKAEIAKEYNSTKQAIHYILVKHKILVKNKRIYEHKLTCEEESEFLRRYLNNHESAKKLCKEFKISELNGSKFLNRNGIFPQKQKRSYRKYTLNEHYFDSIDTEDKAYFLGLLYADGFNGEDSGEIEISLKDKDIKILEKMNNSIGSNKPIKYRSITNKNGLTGRYARLWIHSKIMSKRLAELGCWQRKSLTLEFPKKETIPTKLIPHFVRGFFDGNAYISKAYKVYSAEVISTEMFLTKLRDILTEELDIKGSFQAHQNGKNKILKIGGTIQTLKFLDWLYKDATIYLDRKYDRYQMLKKDRQKYADSRNSQVSSEK